MCKVVHDPEILDEVQQGNFGRIWYRDEDARTFADVIRAMPPCPTKCASLDEWRAKAMHRIMPSTWRPAK